MFEEKFRDRQHAGTKLAELLKEYTGKPEAYVLGLPRGGVPVAYEIARKLALPLDVLIVRKLGVPGYEELAFGAISSGGTVVYNDEIIQEFNLSPAIINWVIQTQEQELKRRETAYRGERPFPILTGKTIILVDDGIATGATMKAAIKSVQLHKPKKLIVAVPVMAMATFDEIAPLVDKLICPLTPKEFYAVGAWYDYFNQTSDDEVSSLLKKLSS